MTLDRYSVFGVQGSGGTTIVLGPGSWDTGLLSAPVVVQKPG